MQRGIEPRCRTLFDDFDPTRARRVVRRADDEDLARGGRQLKRVLPSVRVGHRHDVAA